MMSPRSNIYLMRMVSRKPPEKNTLILQPENNLTEDDKKPDSNDQSFKSGAVLDVMTIFQKMKLEGFKAFGNTVIQYARQFYARQFFCYCDIYNLFVSRSSYHLLYLLFCVHCFFLICGSPLMLVLWMVDIFLG